MTDEPKPTKAREKQLTEIIRHLLDALDRQTYGRRPPGQYQYSLRVTDAMRAARTAVKDPESPFLPDPDDLAQISDASA